MVATFVHSPYAIFNLLKVSQAKSRACAEIRKDQVFFFNTAHLNIKLREKRRFPWQTQLSNHLCHFSCDSRECTLKNNKIFVNVEVTELLSNLLSLDVHNSLQNQFNVVNQSFIFKSINIFMASLTRMFCLCQETRQGPFAKNKMIIKNLKCRASWFKRSFLIIAAPEMWMKAKQRIRVHLSFCAANYWTQQLSFYCKIHVIKTLVS